MSLYYLQKFLYHLNRDPAVQRRFRDDLEGLLGEYDMTEEERNAIRTRDVGLLYVLGVNGQILTHYAALIGLEWNDYLEAMRRGVARHGPVRSGLYKMTTGGSS
jgi:aromatic-ring opening dioxygenase LigAB LigA subunit